MMTREALRRVRNLLVACAALAYVAATVWQVLERRDDWPLSSYPMYSHQQGVWASKSFLFGVTPEGEYALAPGELGPIGGARLTHLLSKLERDPKRRDRFLETIAAKRRERFPDAAELSAIRMRKKTWRIQQGLKGIDKPRSKLVDAIYFPPASLRARLQQEAEGSAPVEGPLAAAGDLVIDLDEAHCRAGCRRTLDRYAHEGAALSLTPTAEEHGAAEVELEIPAGNYRVFVRTRTAAPRGKDRFAVFIDDRPLSKKLGFGNQKAALGADGYVWVSKGMAYRPVGYREKTGGKRTLRIAGGRGALVVDQIWLSRTQQELPSENRARRP